MTSGRRMALNFLGHAGAQLFNKLYPLIVYPFAQDRLTTLPLGRALFAVSLADWTSPFIEAGTTSLGQIEVGKADGDRDRIATVIGRIHALRLLHAALAFIALQLAVFAFYSDYRAMVLAVSFMLLTSALDSSYVQIGRQEIWSLSILAVVTKALALVAIFTMINGPEDDVTFAVIIVLANSLYSLGAFGWSVAKHGIVWPKAREVTSLYRILWPFLLTVLGYYGLDKFDYLIVEALHDPVDLGVYGAMSRLALALGALVPALVLAFGSEMLRRPGKAELSRQVRLATGVASLIVMPVAIGAFFTGEEILGFFYDAEIARAARALAWLCAGLVPQTLIIVFGVYLLSIMGHAPMVAVWLLVGLGVGAGFATGFDGVLGMSGIAGGVALAKTVAATGVLVKARPYLTPGWAGPLLRNGLAAGVMGVALAAGGELGLAGLWPKLGLGAVVYSVAVLMLNRALVVELIRRMTKFRVRPSA